VVRLKGSCLRHTNRAGVLRKWGVRLPNRRVDVTNRSVFLTNRGSGRANDAVVLTKGAEGLAKQDFLAANKAYGEPGFFTDQS